MPPAYEGRSDRTGTSCRKNEPGRLGKRSRVLGRWRGLSSLHQPLRVSCWHVPSCVAGPRGLPVCRFPLCRLRPVRRPPAVRAAAPDAGGPGHARRQHAHVDAARAGRPGSARARASRCGSTRPAPPCPGRAGLTRVCSTCLCSTRPRGAPSCEQSPRRDAARASRVGPAPGSDGSPGPDCRAAQTSVDARLDGAVHGAPA